MAGQLEWMYIQNYCEDELLSNLQRMGCSELGKPHFFLNTLYLIFAGTWLRWWCWCWTGPSIRTTLMTTPGKFFSLWKYQSHPSIIFFFIKSIYLFIFPVYQNLNIQVNIHSNHQAMKDVMQCTWLEILFLAYYLIHIIGYSKDERIRTAAKSRNVLSILLLFLLESEFKEWVNKFFMAFFDYIFYLLLGWQYQGEMKSLYILSFLKQSF